MSPLNKGLVLFNTKTKASEINKMVDRLTDHAKKGPILVHNLYSLPSQKIPKAKSKF